MTKLDWMLLSQYQDYTAGGACRALEGWLQVMVYTCNEISAVKRNEILTHASTSIIFEVSMLSEISHTQEDEYCMTPLT